MNWTKSEVRTAAGIDTDTELAKFFSTSPSAVCQWPDDEAIPEQRQWQAKALLPKVFTANVVPTLRRQSVATSATKAA